MTTINSNLNINSKIPTFENISKWSLKRKQVLSENRDLHFQIKQKEQKIKELENINSELNLKLKLKGLNFPKYLSNEINISFDFELVSDNGDSLTYLVYNHEFDYENEVKVYYEDILGYIEDMDEVDDYELKNYIKECISDKIYY